MNSARLILLSALVSSLGFSRLGAAPPPAKVIPVGNIAELRAALKTAQPGTRIEVAPGDYEGGIFAAKLRGTKGAPIVIAGADPKNPPHFIGGATGLHLGDASFVELHDLYVSGATENGINMDDGGKYSAELRDILLRGLHIANIGPTGNHDGIKLSGLSGFRVENCLIENWGTGSGSGIDMVGCHEGFIGGCVLRHHGPRENTGASGIQAKGGSRDIVIRSNRFENAGERAINVGGSTGPAYFRPPLDLESTGGGIYEAEDIVVEGNTLIGSDAPLAFVGVGGATVRFNTIYRPGKWAMRILQETKPPGTLPCGNVNFNGNLIVFDSDHWVEGGVNVGPGTAPESFLFLSNAWYCVDQPGRSKPHVPSPEIDGTYGVDPQFENAAALDLRLKAGSALSGFGVQGF